MTLSLGLPVLLWHQELLNTASWASSLLLRSFPVLTCQIVPSGLRAVDYLRLFSSKGTPPTLVTYAHACAEALLSLTGSALTGIVFALKCLHGFGFFHHGRPGS